MFRSKRYLDLLRLSFLLAAVVWAAVAGPSTAAAQAPPAPNPSPFGPNVYVITPTMSTSAINGLLNSLNQEAQFSTNRYAVLFQPGIYGTASNPVGAQVGFYEQVSGLGALPNGVTLTGGMGVDQLIGTAPSANMTQNFWRSMENLTEQAASGPTGNLDWGVSQGASLRRMNIQSNLWLANSGPINGENACQEASGGFMADSVVVGLMNACSQQQWYTRNSELPGGFSGNVWNFVFSGVLPANTPGQSYPGGAAGDDNVTNIATTPVSREKPFLHVDSSGNYHVFVPAAQTNSSGLSWASGQSLGFDAPISAFYIATPSSSITDINNALANSQSLILTPGIYKYNDPIHVTQPGTVVLGMGFATIVPQTGNPGMVVDDVDNVQIAGLLFDAGPVNSQMLLEMGMPGVINNTHANSPSSLNDIYFRIGGATAGTTSEALQIDSGNVIIDNIWAWRADHGNNGTFGWTVNTADHGVVVNGSNVTALGLAVEHFQKEQVQWNGDGGTTIFYQSELPYDPPNQGAWSNGTQNGYPSYVVSPGSICNHKAYGMGIYSYFDLGVNIVDDNALSVPNVTGVQITDAGTVFLNGSGQISNIINGTGGAVSASNSAKLNPLASYTGTATCTATQPPQGSIVPLSTISNPNPNNFDTGNIMSALKTPYSDLVILASHRGVHALVDGTAATIPENSLPAIGLAAQSGLEVVEVDIKLTSDATPEVVLTHDVNWGREWCSEGAAIGPFNPSTAKGQYNNDSKNPTVASTTFEDLRKFSYAGGGSYLRDSVSLYCNYIKQRWVPQYPPKLKEVLDYITKNKISMVLALDIRDVPTAQAAWAIVVNNFDYLNRPYYKSVVFKLAAKNFATPADFKSTFPGIDYQFVNWIPVYNTGDVAPATANNADTQFGGVDVPVDANGFNNEAGIISHLQSFQNDHTIQIVAVEVNLKQTGGNLSTVLPAARVNPLTGAQVAVGNFSPFGEYYDPSDTGHTNPLFYNIDGYCAPCKDLTASFYKGDANNPPDTADNRPSLSFLTQNNYNFITSDDAVNFAASLAAPSPGKPYGLRNLTHLTPSNTGSLSSGPANGRYTLLNVNSGLAMDVSGNSTTLGSYIDQWTPNYGLNQQWQVTSVGTGLYTLSAYSDGLCLDVYGDSVQTGAALDQYTCSATAANQQFTIAQTNDGNYTIVGSQSGLAVEVPKSSLTAGTSLDQWTINGGKSQEWQFIKPGPAPGTYTITNENSGLLMEVAGGSNSTGAAIDQWTSNNGTRNGLSQPRATVSTRYRPRTVGFVSMFPEHPLRPEPASTNGPAIMVPTSSSRSLADPAAPTQSRLAASRSKCQKPQLPRARYWISGL